MNIFVPHENYLLYGILVLCVPTSLASHAEKFSTIGLLLNKA